MGDIKKINLENVDSPGDQTTQPQICSPILLSPSPPPDLIAPLQKVHLFPFSSLGFSPNYFLPHSSFVLFKFISFSLPLIFFFSRSILTLYLLLPFLTLYLLFPFILSHSIPLSFSLEFLVFQSKHEGGNLKKQEERLLVIILSSLLASLSSFAGL